MSKTCVLGALVSGALLVLGCGGGQQGPRDGGQPARDGHVHHDAHEHGGQGHGEHGHGDHATAHHRFEDAERWAKVFEDPARDEWQKPAEVLKLVGLGAGQKLADVGAGTGYFSVRFAKAAAGSKVYAIDVEPDMVRYLGERAKREGLAGLVAVQASADDAKIPEKVDVIFVCDTYHHIGGRVAYFKALKQSLLPGGRLVIVDFKPGDTKNGPPARMRIGPGQVDAELREAGFERVLLDETTLPQQYVSVHR